MKDSDTLAFSRPSILPPSLTLTLLLSTVAFAPVALADDDGGLRPNHLLVSRTVYDVNPSIVPGVTQLPPNCVAPNCVTATGGGAYPTGFNNALVGAGFGIPHKTF